MNTKVVHCKRDAHDVYIGRPSKWGNPFAIGKDGTRQEVIAKYRAWIVNQSHLMADLHELRGKVLGCWCSPEACHGDVLAELANVHHDSKDNWHPVIGHPKWVAYIGRNVGYEYAMIHATCSPLPIFYSDWLLKRRCLRGASVPEWWLGWHSTQAWLAGLQEIAA